MSRILAALCGLLVWACTVQPDSLTEVPTQTLLPRLGPPSTATGPPPAKARPVETAGPTSTPFSHLIAEGDTLLGIALRYGVELNDLLLANPNANPRFLAVGDSLVVPLGGAQGPVPSATPRPVQLSAVNCYPAPSGELWCFVLASLSDGEPVEGLVGLVTLVDTGGRSLRTEPAFSPLNLLLPGSALPLVAYFAPPIPEYGSAFVSLVSAVSAGDSDGRYLAAGVVESQTNISVDQRMGGAKGVLIVDGLADRELAWLRLVLLGLDASDQIVGITILDPGAAGGPDQRYPFTIEVASLGPPIARLVLLAEARAGGS